MSENTIRAKLADVFGGVVAVALIGLVIVGFVLLCTLGVKACNNFNRGQARADARNKVQITNIRIREADEEARINHAQIKAQEAEAQKRVVEAHGLAEAQAIVDHTLTPLYVQHEAIQAQKAIADSGRNNTVIYVPAGTNGTPLITAEAARGK